MSLNGLNSQRVYYAYYVIGSLICMNLKSMGHFVVTVVLQCKSK